MTRLLIGLKVAITLSFFMVCFLFAYSSENKNYYVDPDIRNLKFFLQSSGINSGDVFNLISHGRPGELYIRGHWKSAEELAALMREENWLIGKSHLNIYGCNFAKGEKGKQAVSYLEAALGVSIAASDDITGVDGDWELEVGNAVFSIAVPEYKHNLQCSRTNQALLGTATQSTTDFGGVPSRAIDDNTFGVYDAGSVSHTVLNGMDPFWRVDWVAPIEIQEIVVWNRIDLCCTGDLDGAIVEILDMSGVVVFSSTIVTAEMSNPILVSPAVSGTAVRVRKVGMGHLTLAEVQVYDEPSCPQAYAIEASCTNGVVDPNTAYLQLSYADPLATHYNWSMSSTYSGSVSIVDATPFDPGSDLPVQNIGLGSIANPSGSQVYTIRVFYGNSDDFKDVQVVLEEQDCTSDCDCRNKLYVNDAKFNLVHKFDLDATGQVTEIGSPWFSPILNPHGLAQDINGNLYFGLTTGFTDAMVEGQIYKIDVDGGTTPLSTDAIVDDGDLFHFNFASDNGVLYSARNDLGEIHAYSLCDGTFIGTYGIGSPLAPYNTHNWGFYLDKENQTWYYAERATGDIYSGSMDLDDYGATVINSGSIAFSTGITASSLSDSGLMGITRDANGNFYLTVNQTGGGLEGHIRKYDSGGNFIASVVDNTFNLGNSTDGLAGFWGARGIVYDDISGNLYVGSLANCLVAFDTDLVELTALNIGNPAQGLPKAIGIAKECCPTSNNTIFETVLCEASIGEKFFLQDILSCEGTISEGEWTPDPGNTGITYEPCDNSIFVNAPTACGTFTLSSDGAGANGQCGAYTITFNLTVATLDIQVNQTDCTDNGDGTYTAEYEAVVDWASAVCGGEMIEVTQDGSVIGTIDPSTDTSPSTFSFSAPADGVTTTTITAEFDAGGCSASIDVVPLTCDVKDCGQATFTFETEDFTTSTAANNGDVFTLVPDPLASGGMAMQPLDSDGTNNNSNNTTDEVDCCDGNLANGEAAALTFDVNLDITDTYYLYVSARIPDGGGDGSDSYHAGIDGVREYTSNSILGSAYSWNKIDLGTLTAGPHTINIWQREDGTLIDQVILSVASSIADISTYLTPKVYAYAIQASCVGDDAQNDAYLQISSVEYGDAYHFSRGATFDDMGGTNTYANATDITTATFPLVISSGIDNPMSPVSYTIRVYNGAECCYSDHVVVLQPQTCVVGECDCTDYLYVNDLDLDGVHKFEIDPVTGGLTEITPPGELWISDISDPHGAVFDLNGRLYMADKRASPERLYQLDCDGNRLDTLFEGNFDGEEYNNFVTIGNYMYVNGRNNNDIKLYDLCEERLIGRLDYAPFAGGGGINNWELMQGQDGNLYTIDQLQDTLKIYRVPTDAAFYTIPTTTTILPYLTTNLVSGGFYWGLEQTEDGYWFVLNNEETPERIYVIDPSGVVVDTIMDPGGNDGIGFDGGRGFEYHVATQTLYVASEFEDCVALFDVSDPLNAVYLSTLSIPNGGGKDLSLSRECCPSGNNITIREELCSPEAGVQYFLNELFPCDGVLCYGAWVPDPGNVGIVYDECDNSFTIPDPTVGVCVSFIKDYDGVGSSSSACGAFTITFNLTVATLDLQVNQTDCTDNGDGTFTADYEAVVDWTSAVCDGEMIEVTQDGSVIATIDPATETSPATISFSAPADGIASTTIMAEFDGGGCRSSTSVTPDPCPDPCSLNSPVITSSCNDNGTPSDASDDYIEFTVNVDGSNTGTTYTVTAAGHTVTELSAPNSYGVVENFRLETGSAGGGDVTITITDDVDGTCTVDGTVIDPGICFLCPDPNCLEVQVEIRTNE